MKPWKWITLYVVGAIFTNSYVRLYRIEEWDKEGRKALHSLQETVLVRDVEELMCENKFYADAATVLWPFYAAAKAADCILTTRVKVEPPEILKEK
jgi:hypothetical protein